MRERAVDIALLAGLVIVCVLIVFALFSPGSFNFFGSTPSQTVTTPEAAEITETSSGEANVGTGGETGAAATTPPVIPSEGTDGTVDAADDSDDATAQEVDASATATAAETSADTATDEAIESENTAADSEATTDGETAAETTEAPPPGSVQLERVGFSFVTGNAHACGVVLEAWEHVAVSRDLLERYPCGSEVTLNLDEPVDGRSSVTAVVGDTMNPDTTNTVNIYVGTDEPAQEYGVQTGQISGQASSQ